MRPRIKILTGNDIYIPVSFFYYICGAVINGSLRSTFLYPFIIMYLFLVCELMLYTKLTHIQTEKITYTHPSVTQYLHIHSILSSCQFTRTHKHGNESTTQGEKLIRKKEKNHMKINHSVCVC